MSGACCAITARTVEGAPVYHARPHGRPHRVPDLRRGPAAPLSPGGGGGQAGAPPPPPPPPPRARGGPPPPLPGDGRGARAGALPPALPRHRRARGPLPLRRVRDGPAAVAARRDRPARALPGHARRRLPGGGGRPARDGAAPARPAR